MRKRFCRKTRRRLAITCLLVVMSAALYVGVSELWKPRNPPQLTGNVVSLGNVKHWWEPAPEALIDVSFDVGARNNVTPDTYVGSEACGECHRENYEQWLQHPHRWMNALADETSVVGDFSGQATISYLGGEASFVQGDGEYLMHLKRGDTRRVYQATQTIGRRFFQYYVGRQIEGPESPDHIFYHEDHVLPFGYWRDEGQWVPVVHIGDEHLLPDGYRPDPFDPPAQPPLFAHYAFACNRCHNTFAIGDEVLRKASELSKYTPAPLHLIVPEYLAAAHPGLPIPPFTPGLATPAIAQFGHDIQRLDAPTHAVTMGITCEACHLGGRDHAEGRVNSPAFLPCGPELLLQTGGKDIDLGRTTDNINFACGRCHSGGRPTFAAGMSTWNSTESDDAIKGACYSELTCVDCHDPHRATGKQWPHSPASDDARCLSCHQQYEPTAARQQHTHHPTGTSGARCMNCHMPRLNEGLQDIVRTHMIFSPTNKQMIEANHPNACNMCHTQQPIDWTLGFLREWYNATYSEPHIVANYPDREAPTAIGWLKQDDEAVRLVAADALFRTKSKWALPELLDVLDDPYLVNRQFGQRGLERLLGIDLEAKGYRFYMTPEERREPLEQLRESVEAQMGESD